MSLQKWENHGKTLIFVTGKSADFEGLLSIYFLSSLVEAESQVIPWKTLRVSPLKDPLIQINEDHLFACD